MKHSVLLFIFLSFVPGSIQCHWASRFSSIGRVFRSYAMTPLHEKFKTTFKKPAPSHQFSRHTNTKIYPYFTATSIAFGLSTCKASYCEEKALEDNWVDLEEPNKSIGVYTPLSLAAKLGDYKNLKKLLDAGADPNAPVPLGSALHIAARDGHVKMVQELVARGADVWQQSDSGSLPLHNAVENGQEDVVKYLLTLDNDQKTMANMPNHRDIRPLEHAVYDRNKQIIAYLLAHGALVESRMIRRAVFVEGTIFKLLFENSYSRETIPQELLDELLIDASQAGNAAIVRYLCTHGADINGGRSKTSPLIEAATRGDVNLVTFFCSQGADLNKKDTGVVGELSALRKASLNGHTEVVKLLLDAGADPFTGDSTLSSANYTVSCLLFLKRLYTSIRWLTG